jgi:hypothetical protein
MLKMMPWQGGTKVSEASVIYQELGERHNWTVQLYNSAAACAMQLGNWEEAEQYLQVSLHLSETLIPGCKPTHLAGTLDVAAYE